MFGYFFHMVDMFSNLRKIVRKLFGSFDWRSFFTRRRLFCKLTSKHEFFDSHFQNLFRHWGGSILTRTRYRWTSTTRGTTRGILACDFMKSSTKLPVYFRLHSLFFQTLPHRYQTSTNRYLTCMLAYLLHMFYQIKNNRWRIPFIGFKFWPIRIKKGLSNERIRNEKT